MSKNLPADKIDKLSDRFADDIIETVKHHVDDLKKHEVGNEDIGRVLRDGYKKVGERVVIKIA